MRALGKIGDFLTKISAKLFVLCGRKEFHGVTIWKAKHFFWLITSNCAAFRIMEICFCIEERENDLCTFVLIAQDETSQLEFYTRVWTPQLSSVHLGTDSVLLPLEFCVISPGGMGSRHKRPLGWKRNSLCRIYYVSLNRAKFLKRPPFRNGSLDLYKKWLTWKFPWYIKGKHKWSPLAHLISTPYLSLKNSGFGSVLEPLFLSQAIPFFQKLFVMPGWKAKKFFSQISNHQQSVQGKEHNSKQAFYGGSKAA